MPIPNPFSRSTGRYALLSLAIALAWLIAVYILLISLTGCSRSKGECYHARCLVNSDTIYGMLVDKKLGASRTRRHQVGDTVVLDSLHYVIYSVTNLTQHE